MTKYDYDLVVIGGGAAGLVAASAAAMMGAKTAMIEKNKLGGDCTWYGCVPSKALLKAAHSLHDAKKLGQYGIESSHEIDYDLSAVMDKVRAMVEQVSSHHPASVFEERGIKVIYGSPKFCDERTIVIDGNKIRAKRFIIATGSHPMVPPIDGLSDVDYLTNENVFELTNLPKSLVVLGGGPIGLELSQAFSRLGVKVTIVEMAERLLAREDEEISAVLHEAFLAEDIELETSQKAVKVAEEAGEIVLTVLGKNNNESTIKAEKILVAVGRSPNLDSLELKNAGVKYTAKGIVTNKALQTSAKRIYAAGDVVGLYQFSHMAEYQAIIATSNALMPYKQKVDYSSVAWCTFTEPELARVGLTEGEAKGKYKTVKIYRSEYKNNDRAVVDRDLIGKSKVICDAKGRILGAHIVGTNAGEILHEYILAKKYNLKISKLSATTHIYPTLAQLVKRTADASYDEILNSGVFKFFTRLMLTFIR